MVLYGWSPDQKERELVVGFLEIRKCAFSRRKGANLPHASSISLQYGLNLGSLAHLHGQDVWMNEMEGRGSPVQRRETDKAYEE
jgi:hypothetical protein